MNTTNTGTTIQHTRSYQATVVSTTRITPDSSEEEVREIIFDVHRKDSPYQVGQCIGVLAPRSEELGEEQHLRLYSLAEIPERNETGQPRVTIYVLRCVAQDADGVKHPGIASNYLCDLKRGNTLSVTGPMGLPFDVPKQLDANLVLIGTGTGVAPFRAFVKYLYHNVTGWNGRIWQFYGASCGLENLFIHDKEAALERYVDKEAFEILSPQPNWAESLAGDSVFSERSSELWGMMSEPKTYVYVAGQAKTSAGLDDVFSALAGSSEQWALRKSELMTDGRWIELLY